MLSLLRRLGRVDSNLLNASKATHDNSRLTHRASPSGLRRAQLVLCL